MVEEGLCYSAISLWWTQLGFHWNWCSTANQGDNRYYRRSNAANTSIMFPLFFKKARGTLVQHVRLVRRNHPQQSLCANKSRALLCSVFSYLCADLGVVVHVYAHFTAAGFYFKQADNLPKGFCHGACVAVQGKVYNIEKVILLHRERASKRCYCLFDWTHLKLLK